MNALISQSPHKIDVVFLPKGLHDLPAEDMRGRLQATIDSVPEGFDAVLMGYGLCNNGLHHIEARYAPLILPRSHDCIGIFLGSRQRYTDYFWNNPGTYFKTSGWIERGETTGELKQLSIGHQAGLDMSFKEMVEKYGEDNAVYLMEAFGKVENNYGQITFIEMGIEPDKRFEESAKATAREKGWKFEKQKGNMNILRRLLDGEWDNEDFLTVQPGERFVARYDEKIIAAETVPGS
ncbi:MAG: DUF1638 domain-containing protein [Proteobacteria bacterium]|nr:DUF1638 domain-containing protein [Pseudomonadota bacterium]